MNISDGQKDILLRGLAVILIGMSPLATEHERELADDLIAGAKRAVVREAIVALGTIRDQVTANVRQHQAAADEATLLDNPDFVEWAVRMKGFYE